MDSILSDAFTIQHVAQKEYDSLIEGFEETTHARLAILRILRYCAGDMPGVESRRKAALLTLATFFGRGNSKGFSISSCLLSNLKDGLSALADYNWGRVGDSEGVVFFSDTMDYLVSSSAEDELENPVKLRLEMVRVTRGYFDLLNFLRYFQEMCLLLDSVLGELTDRIARLPLLLAPLASTIVAALVCLTLQMCMNLSVDATRSWLLRRKAVECLLRISTQALAMKGLGCTWRDTSDSGVVESFDSASNSHVSKLASIRVALGRAGCAFALHFAAQSIFFWGTHWEAIAGFAKALECFSDNSRQLVFKLDQISGTLISASEFVDWMEKLQETRLRQQSLFQTIHLPTRPYDIAFQGVKYRVGRISLVIDLVIPWGSHVCIAGPSGCGKSTLLSLMRNATTPDEGRILIGGTCVSLLATNQMTAVMCSALQGCSCIFDHSTVREMMLAASGDGLFASVTDDEVIEMLIKVGLPRTKPDDLSFRLSGGEKQRVAVARALFYASNKILALDEPCSALDETTERSLMAKLRASRKGETTLVISHGSVALEAFQQILEIVECTDSVSGEVVNRCQWRTCSLQS